MKFVEVVGRPDGSDWLCWLCGDGECLIRGSERRPADDDLPRCCCVSIMPDEVSICFSWTAKALDWTDCPVLNELRKKALNDVGRSRRSAPVRSRALKLCVGAVQGYSVEVLLSRGGMLSNASFARRLGWGPILSDLASVSVDKQCFKRDQPLFVCLFRKKRQEMSSPLSEGDSACSAHEFQLSQAVFCTVCRYRMSGRSLVF